MAGWFTLSKSVWHEIIEKDYDFLVLRTEIMVNRDELRVFILVC